MELFATVSVDVLTPGVPSIDSHGNAVPSTPTSETVSGVLPQPGGTADLDASRPDGVMVSMTFHWPRGDHRPLKGCTISYDGRDYRVIGDPQPYISENCPGPFDRPVETEVCDG